MLPSSVLVPLDRSTSSPAQLTQLTALTAQDMVSVNALIIDQIHADTPMIMSISEHLFTSSSKRLRPMLTLATCRCLGYEGREHVTLATAIEFLHTATLLHDDVVDESSLRRGRKTARLLWGNQASVLVGDYLLGQAFKLMVSTKNLAALEVLSAASSTIAQGEVMQLAAAHNLSTSEDEYLKIIHAKTAELFAAATEMGPIITGQPQYREALRQYGFYLGITFQIVDDILDYQGDSQNLGKNTGDDFREGKITLPLLLSYQNGTTEQKIFWEQKFTNELTDDLHLRRALEIMDQTRALELSKERAMSFAHRAEQALAPLPGSSYKDALLETITFCLQRIQ